MRNPTIGPNTSPTPYDTKEFHNWDTVSAVYLTNPELFEDNVANVVSTVEDLKTGFLKIDNSADTGYKVNILPL